LFWTFGGHDVAAFKLSDGLLAGIHVIIHLLDKVDLVLFEFILFGMYFNFLFQHESPFSILLARYTAFASQEIEDVEGGLLTGDLQFIFDIISRLDI